METVISEVTPPMSALVLRNREELLFLPGGDGSIRTGRYTRLDATGQPIDYWLGVPALTTDAALCTAVAANPGTRLVIPKTLWDDWGEKDAPKPRVPQHAKEMQDFILGSASPAYDGGAATVYRVLARDEWTDAAAATCRRALRELGGYAPGSFYNAAVDAAN